MIVNSLQFSVESLEFRVESSGEFRVVGAEPRVCLQNRSRAGEPCQPILFVGLSHRGSRYCRDAPCASRICFFGGAAEIVPVGALPEAAHRVVIGSPFQG